MKRFLAAIATVAVLFGVSDAFAAATWVNPTYVGQKTSLPGVKIPVPAGASGDTVLCIVDMTRIASWNVGGNTTGVPYQTVSWAFGAYAAGDSVRIAVDIGCNPVRYGAAWLAMDTFLTHLNTLGGNATISTTVNANPVKQSHLVTSTWMTARYWRVRILYQSTLSTSTFVDISFPRQAGQSYAEAR